MRNKEEEKDTFQKQLEECTKKSYVDAHKIITQLHKRSLIQNNLELSNTICRVRILIENQASEPNTYMQKTLLHYRNSSRHSTNVYIAAKTVSALHTLRNL
jgi:hypothetical protein